MQLSVHGLKFCSTQVACVIVAHKNREIVSKEGYFCFILNKNSVGPLNIIIILLQECTSFYFWSPAEVPCMQGSAGFCGSTTTERDKLTTNQLTANNVDRLRRAILDIFLLSPEPSCPNPHFVMKSVMKTYNEIIASRSVDLARVFAA